MQQRNLAFDATFVATENGWMDGWLAGCMDG